jgi:drug/metabolite transporter (DMT)-like permease
LVLAHGLHSRWRGHDKQGFKPDWGRAWPWATGNAVIGAVLGVSCYNWALKSSPSAVVLPIVATSPLCVMLLTLATEGLMPRRRAIVGAVLAVIGVIILVRNA